MTSLPEYRRPYIDRARGVAVFIMILAHTLDAWTRQADRSTIAFRNLTILGGFAAPLFLWLAGVGFVLAGERTAQQTGSRERATMKIIRRGIEIFLLAFLFRLQAFVVSPGSAPVSILRVDILNIMGPAIVLAGIIWGIAGSARYAALLSAAGVVVIAMVTPLVRAAGWVNHLPVWGQWYFRPSGVFTTFTLFPWAGFVLAGAAAGAILSLAPDRRVERWAVGALAASGGALVWGGFFMSTLPTIYASSTFWTSSPTYFAIRLGVLMLTVGLMFAMTPRAPGSGHLVSVLERFGRHSLFIYWIHVELVYGYATWPIHRKLPLEATLAAYALFCGVMYGAMHLRDRVAGAWNRRRASQQVLQM